MYDKIYYLNDKWYTWDQVHSLGYTKSEAIVRTFYTRDLQPVTIYQDNDVGEDDFGKFYDESNKIWIDDITQLNLYYKVGELHLYTGEIQVGPFEAFSASALNQTPTHITYEGRLTILSDLYQRQGYTVYQCVNYSVENGVVLVWFDPVTNLYWNNVATSKMWSTKVPTKDNTGFPTISYNSIDHYLLEPNLGSYMVSIPNLRDNYVELGNINQYQLVPKLSSTLVTVPDLSDKAPIYSGLTTTTAIYRLFTTTQVLNGITYNSGDAITILSEFYTENMQPYYFYKSVELFGDSLSHTPEEFNSVCELYNLIEPARIIVGTTTSLPLSFTSMPNTNWWWCGGFSSGSSIANWYTTNSYATNPFPILDTKYEPVSSNPTSGTKYLDAIISNNSSILHLTNVKIQQYNNTPEIYTSDTTSLTRSSTSSNNTFIVKCNKDVINTTWPLPSNLYSLAGRVITWNTSSPYFLPFYGIDILI